MGGFRTCGHRLLPIRGLCSQETRAPKLRRARKSTSCLVFQASSEIIIGIGLAICARRTTVLLLWRSDSAHAANSIVFGMEGSAFAATCCVRPASKLILPLNSTGRHSALKYIVRTESLASTTFTDPHTWQKPLTRIACCSKSAGFSENSTYSPAAHRPPVIGAKPELDARASTPLKAKHRNCTPYVLSRLH